MANKLYTVKAADAVRLVSASNKVAALRHIAQSVFEVSLAKDSELIQLTKAGVEVEYAAAPAEDNAETAAAA